VSVVVDASEVVALLLADGRPAAAQEHLERWVGSGEELHAPAVLPYEVVNVLARLVSDGDLEADSVAETWSDLAALGMKLHPVDLAEDGPVVAAITTQLRRRHATHSTCTHLAQQLGTHVWTLDGPLARSAADLGLAVKLVT
jgi:predicted nucleic acid-binding protein